MRVQLREHIEKVVPLTDEEYAFVISHFKGRKYKKHQYVIQQGDPVPFNYFVLKGLLKLVFTDDTEKQHIISFAMEDWWESDFYAYYTQTNATMSLECLEDTEVLCLSLEDYEKLCNGLQKIERFFLEKAKFGFLGAQRRIISSLTSNVKERYEHCSNNTPPFSSASPKASSQATWAFREKP